VFVKWLYKKIPSYYIMIDPDYTKCSSLSIWSQYANPETKAPIASKGTK
jgi:hypothetical protein